jgi:hypothetical protein
LCIPLIVHHLLSPSFSLIYFIPLTFLLPLHLFLLSSFPFSPVLLFPF